VLAGVLSLVFGGLPQRTIPLYAVDIFLSSHGDILKEKLPTTGLGSVIDFAEQMLGNKRLTALHSCIPAS
jgi:hypothetical protein